MLLKRHYKDDLKTLDHIEVRHTGVSAEQNFSTRLVVQLIAVGAMTLGRGKLTLHAKPEDLVYEIKRMPGYYCCHCGEALDDAGHRLDDGMTKGQKHVAERHAGLESPDPGNPAGYGKFDHYACLLAAEQHEKFKAVSNG